MTVYCEDCTYCDQQGQPWQWLCTASPLDWSEGFGFVTRSQWDKAPPFRKCVKVNESGECEMYEEKRHGAEA